MAPKNSQSSVGCATMSDSFWNFVLLVDVAIMQQIAHFFKSLKSVAHCDYKEEVAVEPRKLRLPNPGKFSDYHKEAGSIISHHMTTSLFNSQSNC